MLVEGAESDGETMLYYESDLVGKMEYEYDVDSHACGYGDNINIEDDCSDRECLSYPTKRKQRREKLHSLHCYVAQTSAVAVAASASIMAEGAAAGGGSANRSIVAANAAILACVVGGIMAVSSNLLSSFANAIGNPPHRAEGREDETPPVGFWLKHLCGLFCFASLVMFGIGFLADPIDHSSTMSSISEVWLLSNTSTDDQLFRVLSVIALSLISGCLLGLKHPLQSALLCGL
jgi:hypothetical protein